MRTTVTIPDDLAQEARKLVPDRPLSQIIRRSLREWVERLESERLARELEEGYRAEARDPSLEPEWSTTETEGL